MDAIYLLLLAALYAVTHGLVWALNRLRDLFFYLLFALLRAERF